MIKFIEFMSKVFAAIMIVVILSLIIAIEVNI